MIQRRHVSTKALIGYTDENECSPRAKVNPQDQISASDDVIQVECTRLGAYMPPKSKNTIEQRIIERSGATRCDCFFAREQIKLDIANYFKGKKGGARKRRHSVMAYC